MEEKEQLEALERKVKKVEEFVSLYTFPLLSSPKENHFELYGTCITVLIGGKKYLCTATHVIENLKLAGNPVVVGIHGGFSGVDLETVNYFTDQNIDCDVCLIPFEHAPNCVDFIQHWDFYKGNKFANGSKQYIQGYPVSKNKYSKLHNREAQEVRTGYLKISIKIDQDINHNFARMSNSTHLFFMYDSGAYKKGEGEFIDTKRRSMPGLVGLSGSGIWSILNINDASTIRLAGIFIQHSKRIGVGTKIALISKI